MAREKLFPLETVYPDVSELFSGHLRDESEVIKECLVFLDANILLLLYRMDGASYKELMSAYKTLSGQNRLRIPAQAAREFVKNRGKVIAEIVKNLRGKKGRIPRLSDTTIMRHFDHDEKFKAAGNEMAALIDDVINRFTVIGGQDPITKDYKASLAQSIVDLPLDANEKKDFDEDLRFRQTHDIAPGFKDGGKSDNGSGDLLIWKTIIKHAKNAGKDALFVSGETKSDWFDKIDNQPFSLRYELVEEFRRETSGKSVHVVSASRFLQLMEASGKVVQLTAELEAQSFLSSANLTVRRFSEQNLDNELNHFTIRLEAVKSFLRAAEAYRSGTDRTIANAAGGDAMGYVAEFQQEKAELESKIEGIVENLKRRGNDL